MPPRRPPGSRRRPTPLTATSTAYLPERQKSEFQPFQGVLAQGTSDGACPPSRTLPPDICVCRSTPSAGCRYGLGSAPPARRDTVAPSVGQVDRRPLSSKHEGSMIQPRVAPRIDLHRTRRAAKTPATCAHVPHCGLPCPCPPVQDSQQCMYRLPAKPRTTVVDGRDPMPEPENPLRPRGFGKSVHRAHRRRDLRTARQDARSQTIESQAR